MEVRVGPPTPRNPSLPQLLPGRALHRLGGPRRRRHSKHGTSTCLRYYQGRDCDAWEFGYEGILQEPKSQQEAFANGWFHSGDIGVKHTDGYIEVKNRSKDIIISGGENISSLELESALYLHPAVLEASVVARPDELWEELPCAFLTLKEGVNGSDGRCLAEDIIKFCRSKLPAYWVPKSVVFGSLPKAATGKI